MVDDIHSIAAMISEESYRRHLEAYTPDLEW